MIKSLTITFTKYLSDFFSKGHERTLAAKKNIAASFLIKGISIAISLILVPLTINYINPYQYGIWLTLSSIVAWFSFFDIGFGNGLRNKFAEAKATGDYKKAKIYISTTYAVLAIIFTCVYLLFVIINPYLNWSKILNAPIEMREELSALAFIVFSFFCCQIVLKTISTILIADQKPAKSALFDTIGQLVTLLVISILVRKTNGSLINLGLAVGLSPIFILILSTIYFFNREYKRLAPSIKDIDFSYAKDIMSLGIKFFFIQTAAIIIFQTTNIIIIQLLNPEAVTIYNISYKYFFVLQMIFMIILSPFWSAFTEAFTKQDFSWMIIITNKLKKIWILFFFVAIIMLIISKMVFTIWVGHKINITWSISFLMVIYLLLSMRFNLFIYLINGIGKINLQLIINIALCIIYIPLAVILCKWSGIEGIILGNIIISLIHALVSQIQIKKLINHEAYGIWDK